MHLPRFMKARLPQIRIAAFLIGSLAVCAYSSIAAMGFITAVN